MKINKIDKNVILETIQKEADSLVRKIAIFEEVKKLNSELQNLYENGPMLASFGFSSDANTSSKFKTGFEGSQNISFIAQLEKEMEESNKSNESSLNEVESLKQANEVLRQELEALKQQIATSKSEESK